MIALTLTGNETLEYCEAPDPGQPGPGEVLVAVRASGVCGTDISAWRGKMPFIQPPRILGHELGVEVLALGPSVAALNVGDHCAVEPYLNCGSCVLCRRGRSNCCQDLRVLGVHTDGGWRPRLILPAGKLHRGALSFDQLSLVEPLAIGCHAVSRSGVRAGQTAVVIGAGPIGLSVVTFLLLADVSVWLLETNPARKAAAHQLFPALRTDSPSTPEALAQQNGGQFAEVVFDATGSAASMAECFHWAAFGGQVIYVGITADSVALPDALFHRRELTLQASRNALPEDFRSIIDLMESGRLNATPWITHRATFSQVPAAFHQWADPALGTIKALITF